MSARLERVDFPRRRHELRRGRDGRAARRATRAGAPSPRRRPRSRPCEAGPVPVRPASDLSRLNAARRRVDRGRPPPRSRRCGLAVRAREDTGGRFDPTVLPALVAAGYDRSFEQLAERPAGQAAGWRAGAPIELDEPRGQRPARARHRRRPRRDRQGLRGRRVRSPRCVRRGRCCPAASSTSAATSPSGARRPRAAPGGSRSPTRAAPERTPASCSLRSGGVATSGRDVRRFGPGAVAAPPDRPGDGRAGAAGTARGHRRRAATRPRRKRTRPRSRSRRLAAAAAHVAAQAGISALYIPYDGRSDPAGDAAARERRIVVRWRPDDLAPLAWLIARAAGLVARSGS